MGGRGSSSGLVHKTPNGGTSKPDEPAYLGPRGKEMPVEVALKNTNPHYYEDRKWRLNCQRCVFAYEMQRRGYDVEAKPRILDGTDMLPYGDSALGWTHAMDGMELAQMPQRNTITKMDEQMAAWGDGARAIVRVRWKGNTGGHVFIAERINGQTRYFDPQPGKEINVKTYMDEAIKGKTQLWRTDKAAPNTLLAQCVKRRNL